MNNPLRHSHDLPLFSQIKHQHIEPAIKELIAFNRKTIEDLLANNKPYTWENLILPLENLRDNLDESFGIVKHLNYVRDYPEWRKAHDAVLPMVTEYSIEIGQHQKLYQAILSIQESPGYAKLDLAQKKVIENYLRDFKLSGVSLEKEKKERFKSQLKRLSEVKNKFGQNVLDATDHWFLLIHDENKLKGLPAQTISQAKTAAEKHQQAGWRITLDYPCYHSVICYADDPELRKTIYKAYYTLASDQSSLDSKWNNNSLMVEQLKLKQEISELLGFDCYAEYSLVKKMLKTPKEVLDFLNQLIGPVKTQAGRDLEQLKHFAEKEYGVTEIQPWDVLYFTEKLIEKNYVFSEEILREYFPASQVIKGLFMVANQLFNVTFKEIDDFDTWHSDVKLFEIRDQEKQLLGRFYMDLYARPHKRKGAWCDDCKHRKEKPDGSIQTPIAYIVANFRPAAKEGQEALLSHEEVITLFHEFGHCLHFIFSKVNYPSISSGKGVSWDAIELPSQLMENWCWEEPVIHLISKHVKGGEPLPASLFSKLKSSKNFQIGLQMIRQLEYALFDFELHSKKDVQDYAAIQAVLNQVREKTAIVPVPEFNRFANTFSHIFSGGYAAGYYSYLWSEVLSADTYNFFRENHQVFDQNVANRFQKNILEPGGSQEFMDLYLEFCGRAPKVNALLKDWGLV